MIFRNSWPVRGLKMKMAPAQPPGDQQKPVEFRKASLSSQAKPDQCDGKQITIDGLGRQVALKRLVDGHPIHIGVIHEPDDLVAEELAVVLQYDTQVLMDGQSRIHDNA